MTIIRIAEPFGHFRVTYSSVTEDSAECGDFASQGYLDWQGNPVDEYFESEWDFRDIMNRFADSYVEGDGASVPSFISIDPESDFWLSSFWRGFAGDDAISATAYIHRPSWVSDGSWLRILRCLGWRNR